MVHFSASHEEIRDHFTKLNIPIEKPGFYDHPNFIFIEKTNPIFLVNYARYVSTLQLSDEYLHNACLKIPIIVEELYKHLSHENQNGRCVDISGILSRMLEKENIWNFAVKGSLTIEFPESSNIDKRYFWSIDTGNFIAGHAWVCAPPYDVIDLTIRHQPYSDNERDFLPNYILSKNMSQADSEINDIMNSEVIKHFLTLGIPLSDQLRHVDPNISDIIKTFPAKSITINETTLKYIPVAGLANDGSLEKITNMSFQGKLPLQLYEEDILPKLNVL